MYADDGASEVVKEFASGTLTLGIDDLGPTAAAALVGARVDSNGVLVSASADGGAPVAIGFRAARSSGKYQYFWLYRVKVAVPKTSLSTKADRIKFATPEIEGTILRRNKTDTAGKHPWKADVTEGGTGPVGIVPFTVNSPAGTLTVDAARMLCHVAGKAQTGALISDFPTLVPRANRIIPGSGIGQLVITPGWRNP